MIYLDIKWFKILTLNTMKTLTMKRWKKIAILVAIPLVVMAFTMNTQKEGVVSKHGQLSVKGVHIVDKNGEPTQLKGMSLFWSQWDGARFYNKKLVKYMANSWKSGVIRAALGVMKDKDSYLENPETEKAKVEAVIEGAIKNDIYVIVDFHAHHAQKHKKQAKEFFAQIAQKYGQYPNVIYEIYNEPVGYSWDTIKVYAEEVIDTIRHYDKNNIIVVGTPNWSQRVDHAAENPINKPNIAYTLHFYAATHKQELRDIGQKAIDKGLCLMVTEFGTCPASGNGVLDLKETDLWMEWMDENKISWCNWSICDKNETASILKEGARSQGNWIDSLHLTPSGIYIKGKIMEGK